MIFGTTEEQNALAIYSIYLLNANRSLTLFALQSAVRSCSLATSKLASGRQVCDINWFIISGGWKYLPAGHSSETPLLPEHGFLVKNALPVVAYILGVADA